MSISRRILFDVSAHGHGHLAQTARVVAALRAAVPDCRIYARSGLPRRLMEKRLGPVADILTSDTDLGVIMDSDLQVDRQATRTYYRVLHQQYAAHVDELRRYAVAHRIDLICSNAGYMAIDAAQAAGVKSCLFCSLSWDEILSDLFPDDPEMRGLTASITRAYARADLRFRLRPGMPMATLRAEEVPEVLAAHGANVRGALRRHVDAESAPIVLFAFGDWAVRPPPAINRPSHVRYLVPRRWMTEGDRLSCVDDLPFTFRDLIASVDLVVSKSGYGIVTELALSHQRSLLVERSGWPEEPHLLEWLRPHVWFEKIPHLDALSPSRLQDALDSRKGARPADRVAQAGGEQRIVSGIIQALAA